MTNFNGYTGNILDIDLSSSKISIIKQDIKDLEQFIGGFGVNLNLAAERLKPNTDPLSPENVIIIGAGPLVGTITPGSSRTVGCTKFPATGAIANSCGSMSFGFYLKNAGFDNVIISGKANEPYYLKIINDDIEICDAKHIWGKDIVDTTDILRKKHGSCGVIAIGQAGENLVKSSLALIDSTSTFGRGGIGAVLGSKNLKAIVVKGSKGVPIANPKEFTKIYEKLIKRIKNYPQRDNWIELGMLRSLPVGMMLAAKGQKKKARQCNERTYLKKIKKKRIACPSCPMADKDILELREGDHAGLINYTTSVINPFLMMIPLDDIKTHDEAIKVFDIINRYGLDSLTIAALFEFLSKMYEEGIFTEQNTGFKWNDDINTILQLINMIARREGFGDLLADGWTKLGETFEKVKDRMPVVKGLDVIFDPRLIKLGTMEFEQVVNPKGAHVASGGSPTYVGAAGSIDKFRNHFSRMGIPNPAIERIFIPPVKEMGINVGRLTRYSEDWYANLTNLGLCARAQMNRFYGLELVTALYNAVTGLNASMEDLRTGAERSWNLLKILNSKEGFSRKDDSFPKNWFKALKYGENELVLQDFFGTTKITPNIANLMLDDYYDERGWDKINGLPTLDKIKELNLKNYV